MVPLDKAFVNNYSNVYWRKLDCVRNDLFYQKLDKFIWKFTTKNMIQTLLIDKMAFGIDFGNVTKTNEFWCSALVAYIYEEMGFINGYSFGQ